MGGTVLVSVGKIPGIGCRSTLLRKKGNSILSEDARSSLIHLRSLSSHFIKIIRAEYNDAMLRDFEFVIASVRITQPFFKKSTAERSNLNPLV